MSLNYKILQGKYKLITDFTVHVRITDFTADQVSLTCIMSHLSDNVVTKKIFVCSNILILRNQPDFSLCLSLSL